MGHPATTIIAAQESPIMDNAILSEREGKVPEINFLTSRVQDLTGKVDFWNRWMLLTLAAAAITAGLIVLTTRLVIVRSGQLATAQDDLFRAKDESKDREIAKLNEKAESEQLARTQLEAKIAPRRLDLDQQVKIAENCKGFSRLFAGKRVKVVSYSLDTEGFVLAEQVV